MAPITTHNWPEKFREVFGYQASVNFVLLGTAANVLGIKALINSFHSIICAETAHIHVDECGAPEKFTGCKIIPIVTDNGKITPEAINKHLHWFGFEHHSQPKVISISQPTELGTVYTAQEIKELADLAHNHGMYLHVDGARIANAAASLEISFKEMITDTGVDVLSFGGTKNGFLYGEAIVFLKNGLDTDFMYYRKQGMQSASKMRYITAQFLAYFHHNLWLQNASNANRIAQLLASEVSKINEIKITQEVKSNGVFAIVPKNIIEPLQQEYFFYVVND